MPNFHAIPTLIPASFYTTALVIMGLLTSACSPVNILNAVISDKAYRLTSGVAYGDSPRKTLDIYIPANPVSENPELNGKTENTRTVTNKTLPVVVFFYGGSWDSGNRGSYKFIGEAMTSQGFIAVIPDYRVYPEVLFPGFMEDPAKAAKWVKLHAAEFGGDPERVFLAGHSAGAHIAAMLTLDPEFLAKQNSKPQDFAGMIGLAGPYDFLPLKSNRLKTIFGPEDQRSKSQPINFVTGNNPPMLLMVGTKDGTVWPRNTYNLAAKIKAAGGPVEVAEFAGYGHVDMAAKLAKPLRDKCMLDTIAAFIKQH
ncbi:alpha/beta hydrolase [Methylophilus flavus]|uniref:Alpha/beta hydrolase n=1 Tax=Methylophilus flavus TaxID=640084 RepID=A0ABW3PCX4_9PROT